MLKLVFTKRKICDKADYSGCISTINTGSFSSTNIVNSDSNSGIGIIYTGDKSYTSIVNARYILTIKSGMESATNIVNKGNKTYIDDEYGGYTDNRGGEGTIVYNY